MLSLSDKFWSKNGAKLMNKCRIEDLASSLDDELQSGSWIGYKTTSGIGCYTCQAAGYDSPWARFAMKVSKRTFHWQRHAGSAQHKDAIHIWLNGVQPLALDD